MNTIGYLTYALDRAPGGIGRYTRELLGALRDAGLGVTVLSAGGPPDGATLRLPGAHLLPGLLTLGQAQIAWLARRRGLPLIHDPTGTMPLLLTGARKVVTIHDVIPYIYPETSSLLDRLIYRRWLPLAVRRADAVITVSERSRADILRFLPVRPERVVVIPEAAGERFRPLEPAAVRPALERYGVPSPYMLYVGSIEARKNLARLLEAYAALRARAPAPPLVIVGVRRWKYGPVDAALQRLGLAGHVHFTGFVADADLPALYAGAALFVFPSLYEGFGLPVLEALSCGAPVVTANSSSLPEVAGDAALLVDPLDQGQIAAAMERILTEPDLAAELRARGLARARLFSWGRAARETAALYRRVLEGGL